MSKSHAAPHLGRALLVVQDHHGKGVTRLAVHVGAGVQLLLGVVRRLQIWQCGSD